MNLVPTGDTVALAGAPVGKGIDDLYLLVIAAALIGLLAAGLFSRLAVRNA